MKGEWIKKGILRGSKKEEESIKIRRERSKEGKERERRSKQSI